MASKNYGILLSVGIALLGITACTPSADQLGKILENHPEILANAIEKHPDVFMESIQKAARDAQMKARENAAKQEQARVDEEMKNPLQPAIDESRGFMGSKSAPITIVEYTDFECPFCGRGYVTLEQVRKAYGDKVRVMIKNLPLPMHPLAQPAAKRFEALRLQSPEKAFAFYHEIFSNQSKLSGGENYLDSVVKKVGADLAKVKKDMNTDSVKSKIDADMAEAEKFAISGTPGFIIDGVSVRGAYPFETFKGIIDKKLAAK